MPYVIDSYLWTMIHMFLSYESKGNVVIPESWWEAGSLNQFQKSTVREEGELMPDVQSRSLPVS